MTDENNTTEKNQCKGIARTTGNRCTRKLNDAHYCKQHADQAPGADAEDSLTDRQRLFAEFYLANGFDRTKAAIQAGYSEHSAKSKANDLMIEPRIKATIQSRLDEHAMTAAETMARLTEWGRGTMAHFVDDEGQLDLESESAKAHRHLIKEVKTDQYGVPISIKLHDPQKPVSTIAKIHGMVRDRVEHSGSVEHRTEPLYDYSVLSDDELDQLEAITAKLEATLSDDEE